MGGGDYFWTYLEYDTPDCRYNSKRPKTTPPPPYHNYSLPLMGNLYSKYGKAKTSALDTLQHTRKGKKVIVDVDEEDSSDDEVELVSESAGKETTDLHDSLRDAFAPLTQDQEAEVSSAFSDINWDKVLVSHDNSNIEITGQVLQCLKPGAWLNDEVINLYLELLKERENREPNRFLKCHFFSVLFYEKLISGEDGYDFKNVRRWTTQRNIGYTLIECDMIFVPIHKERHWCLAIINKKDKKFQYLDSLKGTNSNVLQVVARYYVDEVKDKSGIDIDLSSWKMEYVDDLPAQKNSWDCGVFMIKYVDFYSRGSGLLFDQGDMPYFRRRTAKEILRLKAE